MAQLAPQAVPAAELPISVELLGPPRLVINGARITSFRSSRIVALFAFLAFHTGRRSREEIAEALWPESTTEAGRHNLRQTLVYVRQLGGMRAIRSDAKYLELGHCEVDVRLVLEMLDRGGSAEERLARAEAAVDAYHGMLLPDHSDAWLLTPRSQLSQLYVSALMQVSDAVSSLRPQQALDYLDRAIREEPLSDSARARKISILRRLGEHSAAQQEFVAYRAYLLDELGITPSPMVEEALQSAEIPSAPAAVRSDPGSSEEAIAALLAGRRPQQAVELACALTPYWMSTGAAEYGREVLEQTVARVGNRIRNGVRESSQLALAELCLGLGDLSRAGGIIELLTQRSQDPLVRTRAWLLAAKLAITSYHANRAEEFLMRAQEMAISGGYVDEQIETYRWAPKVALLRNNPDQAEQLAVAALEALRALGEPLLYAEALVSLAYAQSANGNEAHARRASDLAKAAIGDADSPTGTWVRVALARLHEEMGDTVGVEAIYRRGVAEAKQSSNPFVTAINLTYLGDYLLTHGAPEDAILIHQEALALRRKLDERLGMATSLRGLGRAYLHLENLPEAREALTESARLFQATEALPGHASALLALGQTELRSGNFGLASRLGGRSLQLLRGMTPSDLRSIGPGSERLLIEAESLSQCLETGPH